MPGHRCSPASLGLRGGLEAAPPTANGARPIGARAFGGAANGEHALRGRPWSARRLSASSHLAGPQSCRLGHSVSARKPALDLDGQQRPGELGGRAGRWGRGPRAEPPVRWEGMGRSSALRAERREGPLVVASAVPLLTRRSAVSEWAVQTCTERFRESERTVRGSESQQPLVVRTSGDMGCNLFFLLM